MKKIVLIFVLLSASLFALDKDYSASYPFCTTKDNLELWLVADKDTKRAMYGTKCYVLTKDISVTGVDIGFMSGVISFYIKGEKFYGLREGI